MGALLCLAATPAIACTVCGSSAINQYLGVLPQFHKHFVSLQYQYRNFRSEHPGHGEDASSFSNENYNTLQLWGRANLGKRVQLFAFVPYVSNTTYRDGVRTRIEGRGDISLLANVRLAGINTAGNTWQHNLQAGGGIKAPTGAYDAAAATSAGGLPNMQPGTGAWDVTANTNYTIRRKAVGLNVDVSYTLTTPNARNYKYGNRASAGVLGFYWLSKNDWSVLPQLGMRLDIAGGDYDNYALGFANDMMGGEQLYATAGLQTYYKRIGAQLTCHKPVYQHYAGGMVNTLLKLETTVYWLF
jgi:hypothetical protein